jgi:Yip1 domain
MTTEPLDLSLKGLVALAWTTLFHPRQVAERIMAQDLPIAVLWLSLALVVVVSVILGQVTLLMMAPQAPMALPLLGSPMAMGLLHGLLLGITIYAIHVIGRSLGGQGRFEDVLALIIWLQFVMICLQVVQSAAMLIVPAISDLLGLVGLVLFLWLLTSFIATAHRFQSLGLVFVMVLVSAFALTFIFSLLLAILGFDVSGVENA